MTAYFYQGVVFSLNGGRCIRGFITTNVLILYPTVAFKLKLYLAVIVDFILILDDCLVTDRLLG